MKMRNLAKKELISNCDYMMWLEKFTLLYSSFADNTWLYKPDEISENEKEKVEKLELFFEGLSEYCHKYYINISCNERFEEERINIKHDGIGYQLGLVIGQGGYVYVERKEPDENAIEFSDVLNDVVPADFESKKALLMQFEQLVSEIKAKDIPTSILLKIVNG